ncbi:uncharacterized protein LOC114746079 [Neltuma alba]|uniref:uncharacterized protein LOC114746079 n=1 Tax=Neltuma alba TaxID=207710 RepID=UPI0010A51D76|nr:uncharacterized protein LOC114746079 [Prosopis alba]
MNTLIWNCQGAAKSKFHSVLKSFIAEHKPDVLVLIEPRVSGPPVDRIIRSFGFPNSHRVEACGFSGGIWLLWSDRMSLQIIHSHWQFIHTKVRDTQSNQEFYFSAIYGSPNSTIRAHLWPVLMSLAPSVEGPWALAGDFNAVLASSERRTTSGRNTLGCSKFQAFVNDNSLVDLGYSGPKFTWRRGLSFARLDRVLVNTEWVTSFTTSTVTHLPKLQSDHRPLKLHLQSPQFQTRPTASFKFLAAWLTHTEFKGLVEDTWKDENSLSNNIQAFRHSAASWNRDTFGEIGIRKRRLTARLAGLQKALESKPHSAFLIKLNRELTEAYETICFQQELLWIQKSRALWINLGDRNTSYYHAKAKIRKARNRITALKDSNGSWVSDDSLLQQMTRNYFVELYSRPDQPNTTFHLRGKFPSFLLHP